MIRYSSFLCVGLVLLLFSRANIAWAQIITLDSALSRIDRENPALQEYDHKANALNAYAEGATSWMAPMIGAGTFMTPYPGQRVTEPRDKGFVMVSVEQNIPNPARLNANRKYLNSKSAVELEGRTFMFNELRSEARMLYYEWLILTQKEKVLQQSKAIVEFILKLAQIRYPYSQGPISKVYMTEGRLSEIENMILTVEASSEEKKFRLRSLMNLSQAIEIQPDTTSNLNFDPVDIAADTLALLERRSDVQQIERTIEAMNYNQRLQRAQAKPDFRLRFDHMSPLGNGMPGQFTAMGMVSIPIAPWSSRLYRSEVKGIAYDINAMRSNQKFIMNEVRAKVSFLYSRILLTRRQLDNYEKRIVPALRKNYETLLLAYQENREQLPAVIDGWEALNAAELDKLDKRESYYTLIVNYEKELEK